LALRYLHFPYLSQVSVSNNRLIQQIA